MIDILENLARNSPSATARVQAIKTLRMIEAEQRDEADAESQAIPQGFEGLYAVEPNGPKPAA